MPVEDGTCCLPAYTMECNGVFLRAVEREKYSVHKGRNRGKKGMDLLQNRVHAKELKTLFIYSSKMLAI